MISEHALVVLTCDQPLLGLHAGDVGAVVHVYTNGNAYEVEFVDGDGSTVATLTLDAKNVRNIGPGELLHTRRHTDGSNQSSDQNGRSTNS